MSKDPMTFPPVIAGCMNWGQWGAKFTTPDYRAMVESCLEAGVDVFDHADIYGHYTTEAEFGKVLQEAPSLRERMRLITKCGIRLVTPNRPDHRIKSYDTSRSHIVASAEQSLRNLHTDRIDLLLIHRPDPLMDPQEVAEAFKLLHDSGKVLRFGVSNFNTHQVELLRRHHPVEVNQVEVSIAHTEPLYNGVLHQAQREGIRIQAWSPLGAGRLNGESSDERNRRIAAMADILSERHGCKPEQVILSWLFRHPARIVPVIGTTRMERVRDAVQSKEIELSAEEWFMLLRASAGHEVA
jgi:predicted oxidoreductase